jgi:GNAT superfamily N-acetyltransferase
LTSKSSGPPRIESLADHADLVPQVGHLRWREWGDEDLDPNAWITLTRQEAGRNHLPVTLVAIDPSGDAVGAVALGLTDGALNDHERRERSPWLLGMVVRSDARRQGVGRLLVSALERVAADRGYSQVWVATGKEAVDFYRSCGWVDEESLTLASTGVTTIILTKQITA